MDLDSVGRHGRVAFWARFGMLLSFAVAAVILVIAGANLDPSKARTSDVKTGTSQSI